jgi:hypothetical protein
MRLRAPFLRRTDEPGSTRRFVLHVGADKTGTTSIQFALERNVELLRRNGFHVLRSNRVRDDSGKHRLAWRRADEAAQLARADVSVIMSNETLWAQPDAVFERLAGAFPDHRPHVVLYVREQAEYLQSLALQHQKNVERAFDLADMDAFDALFERRRDHLDFERTCARYEQVLGPGTVSARLFERSSLVGGDAVLDFFDTIGLGSELDRVARPGETNRSLTVELAQLLQRHGDDLPDGVRFGELQDVACRLSANGLGSKYFLGRDRVDEIRSSYRESNQRFTTRWLANADRLPERDVWRTHEAPLDEIERALLHVASTIPSLGDRGWHGDRRTADRIFALGWRLDREPGRTRAEFSDSVGTIRFRTMFRHRHRFDTHVRLQVATDADQPLEVEVTANGVALGRRTLPSDEIAVPLDSCEPHDQIELLLRPLTERPAAVVGLGFAP